MKTLLYTLAFTLLTAITISSCTEEEIVPAKKQDQSSGGGNSMQDTYY